MCSVIHQVNPAWPKTKEHSSVDDALRLMRHVHEQIEKRQYLNAASAANDLVKDLLGAFAAVRAGE